MIGADLFNEHWPTVPWGKITPFSMTIVTLFFVLSHPEWTAALVWGLGIMLVYWYTRNLWACVVAHAASNAVLGYYILAHQQWHLW
ncbi:MAG: CPBP family glutamic-type intramembrane protease [Gemmatales bacterium]